MQHQFDLPLYHLGNSHFHKNIYQTCTHYPGIVILHDYVLHHFFADEQAWGSTSRYQRELAYNGLPPGTDVADPFAHPLNGRLLDLSLGLIVHSQFVANKVHQQNPSLPVAHIPQLMPIQSGQNKRDELPFPDDAFIFASIGLMTTSKQIEFALRTFAQLAARNANVFYLLVGDLLPNVHLDEWIAELGLQERVFYAGYADNLQQFVDWIVTADVILNLRYPTTGETSATALRAMAAGKPIILFDHAWYGEIPAEACVQLPILDGDALLQSMEKLANSITFRQQMGAKATQYIQTVCHPQKIAQNYVDFIHLVLQKYGGF